VCELDEWREVLDDSIVDPVTDFGGKVKKWE
jgi:hypothetical protein